MQSIYQSCSNRKYFSVSPFLIQKFANYIFFNRLFPSGVATANHLPPSNPILYILFSYTNKLHVLLCTLIPTSAVALLIGHDIVHRHLQIMHCKSDCLVKLNPFQLYEAEEIEWTSGFMEKNLGLCEHNLVLTLTKLALFQTWYQ